MVRLHKLLHYSLVLLLITVIPISQAAERQLEVVTLQHRMAEELLPSLEPFVDKDGVISARGNQIFMRSSLKNLRELKAIIQRLDQASKRLLIEVRQPLSSSRHSQQTNISGSLSLPDNNTQLRLKTYGTSDRDSASTDQQIQVLEGHTALIKTGKLVPMARQRRGSDGKIESVIEQQDVSSGFQVTPRLNGDIVLLEIMPFSASQASTGGGVINQQQAFTTVSTKLGEWLEIGGVSSSQQRNGNGTVYKTHGRNQQQRQILIRVTEQ